jgi:hypothetical protein
LSVGCRRGVLWAGQLVVPKTAIINLNFLRRIRHTVGKCVLEQTLYTWRKRFGEFQPDDMRRLKQLQAENVRLKKLVAERDLEIEVMKEIAAKNSERAGTPRCGVIRTGFDYPIHQA